MDQKGRLIPQHGIVINVHVRDMFEPNPIGLAVVDQVVKNPDVVVIDPRQIMARLIEHLVLDQDRLGRPPARGIQDIAGNLDIKVGAVLDPAGPNLDHIGVAPLIGGAQEIVHVVFRDHHMLQPAAANTVTLQVDHLIVGKLGVGNAGYANRMEVIGKRILREHHIRHIPQGNGVFPAHRIRILGPYARGIGLKRNIGDFDMIALGDLHIGQVIAPRVAVAPHIATIHPQAVKGNVRRPQH